MSYQVCLTSHLGVVNGSLLGRYGVNFHLEVTPFSHQELTPPGRKKSSYLGHDGFKTDFSLAQRSA
jgi:hypothetical protein